MDRQIQREEDLIQFKYNRKIQYNKNKKFMHKNINKKSINRKILYR